MVQIDTSFEGGNLVIDGYENRKYWVRQDWKTSREWWFYWAFRVIGGANQLLSFQFTDGDVFTSMGPCYSVDGKNWYWLGRHMVVENGFSYHFGADENHVFFAVAPIYTERHLHAFLNRYPAVDFSSLWRSELGRYGEFLSLKSKTAQYSVGFLARTHACETIASFVMEGLLEFWIINEVEGEFLRDFVDFQGIPFCDKDGVERGDQGKFRTPLDHNQDWCCEPVFHATRAIQQSSCHWRGKLAVFIDLHCPWICGAANEELFFVGVPEPEALKLRCFCDLLEKTQTGPLHYQSKNTAPYGVGWNQGRSNTASRWFHKTYPEALSQTVEIPYAWADGQTMSPEKARAFGHDLARAISLYLQGLA